MKKFNLKSILVLALAVLTFSCSKEEIIFDPQPAVSMGEVIPVSVSEVSITLTPNEATTKFLYAIGDIADLESFKNGELEGIQEATEEETVSFSGLSHDKEYTIFAIAYDTNGAIGSIATKNFSTNKTLPSINLVFASDESVGMEISTSIYISKVEYFVGKAGLENAFDGSQTINMIEDIPCQYIDIIELEAETEYALYTRTTDRYGEVSDIISTPFTTAATADCPKVSIEVSESDAFGHKIKFVANDKVSKYIVLGGEYDNGGLYDDFIYSDGWAGNVFSMMLSWWGLAEDGTFNPGVEMYYQSEEVFHTTYLLAATQEMEFYVLSYDLDGNPFAVQKLFYSTPTAESKGTPVVTAEIGEMEATGTYTATANFELYPSDNTLGVFYSCYNKNNYDNYYGLMSEEEQMENMLNMMHTQMISGYMYDSEVPWTYTNGNTSIIDYKELSLRAGYEYYLVTIPIGYGGLLDYGKLGLMPFTCPTYVEE